MRGPRPDYSKPSVVAVRRLGQRLGILRPFQRRLRSWSGRSAEGSFDRALVKRIHPGDVVWDIGAHVGGYTTGFAERVGAHGKVVAFEPSPLVLPDLTAATRDLGNVVVVECALSDRAGEATFFEADGGSTTFHGLSAAGSGEAMRAASAVRTERGDVFVRDHPPNVVKIDVEGFELEVLRGMGAALGTSGLHTIGVEVHFQTLGLRGLPDAPGAIVELLRRAEFSVQWTDPSHLIATRSPR